MVKTPEVLAIIPARGGSKGIPRKNVKEFAGYPLIAWSIIAAKCASRVTRIIVSTDDEEIAAIATQWGAEVPFFRPEQYSQDNTLDYPVIRHSLDWLNENEHYIPDIVVQLRPTSPIRPRNCVNEAIKLLSDHPEADCVRGVVEAGQNPYKMWTISPEEGSMIPLLKIEGILEPYNAPRQVLPQTYWQTGHIDAIRYKTIIHKASLTGDVILPLLIDPRYTIDIDIPSDWQSSERLVSNRDLDFVDPGKLHRNLPKQIKMILFDFDGVFTDNHVWISEDGKESVVADRSDGLGLELLRSKTGIQLIVFSRETNQVVTHRCNKLKIPVLQSVFNKDDVIRTFLSENGIDPAQVIYMGNDVNDLVVLNHVGFFVAPADAHDDVRRHADLVLSKSGGKGAIRELCDMIMGCL